MNWLARLGALRDSLAGQVLLGAGGVRYHLSERIGEGGQGWVFRANWDDPDGMPVIVKVLRPDAVNRETLSRFEREAQVLRHLSQQARPNPHIVRFFDHAVTSVRLGTEVIHLPFTVLEYVHGQTLERVLEPGPLPIERTRRILRQVVLALETVHDQKIVHRDLKPSNILLANEGGNEVAKVTDFGLVKLADVALHGTAALAGASLGYAPPEQYEQGNQRVASCTDVFSLAAIAFEMLTGKKAFPYDAGENPLVIITRLVGAPRPSIAKSEGQWLEVTQRPDLIERIDREFARATSADPQGRHASITAFWAAFEPHLRALAETSTSEAKRRRSSSVPPGYMSAPPQAAGADQKRDASASLPAPYRFRLLTSALGSGAFRAASFQADGERVIALSSNGLCQWEGGHWHALSDGDELQASRGNGLLCSADQLVVFGTGSLLAMKRAGRAQHVRFPDADHNILGAFRDDVGILTFVGAHAKKHTAFFGQVIDANLTLLAECRGCPSLRAVTRLRNGSIVACGDMGALATVELGVAQYLGPICRGHLMAIQATNDGGACMVGRGGHALSMTPRFESALEPVQTTRDVLCIAQAYSAHSTEADLWAGAAEGRLLKKIGHHWLRMNSEPLSTGTVIAIHAAPNRVRAICDDGSVVEGTP